MGHACRAAARAVLTAAIVLVSGPALATHTSPATLHVAPASVGGGSSCTTPDFNTIQAAVDHADPGDTVLVCAGTYAGARIEGSGTATAPITLRAADGVILNALGPVNRHESILEVENYNAVVAHWVIEGFEIVGAPRSGVDIRVAHHITVRKNHVRNSGRTGIFTAFADDVRIEHNVSHDNGEHGVYTSNSGDRPTIRGNELYNNYAAGIHMNGDASFGGDGTISDGLVEANIIHDNGVGGASGINLDGVTNTIIRNNLLYGNHASGISLYKIDGAVCSSNNRVLNNTIVMADDGRWVVNIPKPRKGSCVDNKVFNNILYHPNMFFGAGRGSILIDAGSSSGFESHHNVVVGRFSADGGKTLIDLAAWQALGYDASSFISTPDQLFAATDDYRLKGGSPAIDAGAALVGEVPFDLEARRRPQGTGHDIGAYESGTNSTTNLILTKTDDPDPATTGSDLTYTLTVTNVGPAPATGVIVVDTLPAGVDFVSAEPSNPSNPSAGCMRDADQVRCELGDVDAGSGATVQIVVIPRGTGEITNAAAVGANEVDLDTASNQATSVTAVTGAAGGTAPTVASCDPPSAIPGAQLAVAVNGSNFQNGATADFGARVAVSGVTFVSASQLNVQIAVHRRAAVGPRDVTITNPDGQSVTKTGCFSVIK